MLNDVIRRIGSESRYDEQEKTSRKTAFVGASIGDSVRKFARLRTHRKGTQAMLIFTADSAKCAPTSRTAAGRAARRHSTFSPNSQTVRSHKFCRNECHWRRKNILELAAAAKKTNRCSTFSVHMFVRLPARPPKCNAHSTFRKQQKKLPIARNKPTDEAKKKKNDHFECACETRDS